MLSAVVHASANPSDLAVTLAALVPAVAEGLMSHAVVVLEADNPAAERIADAMGASLVMAAANPWRAGAAAARGHWVLLLRAGEEPQQGWIHAVERHLIRHGAASAVQTPALLPLRGGQGAVRERLAVMLTRAAPRPGLVAPRAAVAEGVKLAAPLRLASGRVDVARTN
jgi:hypothetical protein